MIDDLYIAHGEVEHIYINPIDYEGNIVQFTLLLALREAGDAEFCDRKRKIATFWLRCVVEHTHHPLLKYSGQ